MRAFSSTARAQAAPSFFGSASPLARLTACVWGSSASGNLNAGCLSANIDAPYRCFMAQYTTPFITAPLYISQSAIDVYGLLEILQLNCQPLMTNISTLGMMACTPAGWEELQGWWGDFQAVIIPLLSRIPALCSWIVSCYVHSINVDYLLRRSRGPQLPRVGQV